MKQSYIIATTLTVGLIGCVAAGTAIYMWLVDRDTIACVTSEFTFGCATTLGWVLSGVGALVIAGAIYLWERFRGQ